jgi:hypothetical protein
MDWQFRESSIDPLDSTGCFFDWLKNRTPRYYVPDESSRISTVQDQPRELPLPGSPVLPWLRADMRNHGT